jgi:hypothetical protein
VISFPLRTTTPTLQHDTFAVAIAIAMASPLAVVLPGDTISQHALPTGTGKKKTLTLGPGLRHIPPNTVVTTVAGTLVTDNRKNAALVEFNSGRVRYISHHKLPSQLTIPTVHALRRRPRHSHRQRLSSRELQLPTHPRDRPRRPPPPRLRRRHQEDTPPAAPQLARLLPRRQRRQRPAPRTDLRRPSDRERRGPRSPQRRHAIQD